MSPLVGFSTFGHGSDTELAFPAVLVYAVVSDEPPEQAIELFVRRESAEVFLDDVRAGDEELAARLVVEPVELHA